VTAKTICPRRPAPARFYADALSEAERSDLPIALEIEGVDEEIALLRLTLRRLLEEHPEDLALMFKGIDLLVRTVGTRYRLSKRAENDLATSLANVVRGFADIWPEAGHDA
jgi:hypothetical protein